MKIVDNQKRRFAAKLLFQFRAEYRARSSRRRVCEERIVIVLATSPRNALAIANRTGKSGQFTDRAGMKKIFFEYVGVLELKELCDDVIENEPDVVWWEFVEKIEPMERKDHILPATQQLDAFKTISPKRRLTVYTRAKNKEKRARS